MEVYCEHGAAVFGASSSLPRLLDRADKLVCLAEETASFLSAHFDADLILW